MLVKVFKGKVDPKMKMMSSFTHPRQEKKNVVMTFKVIQI